MTPVTSRTGQAAGALSAIVALLTAACAAGSPAVDGAAEEATIRRLSLDWVVAEASNNTDSALAFLWEDATMQPPNAPVLQGHQAIRAAYAKVTFVSLNAGTTTVRVSAAGDLAAIWGPLTVVIKGPNGPITLDEKFVAVWQKRDGKWKVIENSWSDNAPPPVGGS